MIFDPNPDATVSTRQVTLDWLKVGAQASLPRHLVDSLDFSVERDRMRDMLTARITAQLLAERLPTEHIETTVSPAVPVPATWWQHWKAEHPRVWRGWLARRWPVRTRDITMTATLRVDLTRYWTYPRQSMVSASFGEPVRAMVYEHATKWGGQ